MHLLLWIIFQQAYYCPFMFCPHSLCGRENESRVRKWSDKPNISLSTEHCTVSAQSIFTHAWLSTCMKWDAQLCLTFLAWEIEEDSGRWASCSFISLHFSQTPSTTFFFMRQNPKCVLRSTSLPRMFSLFHMICETQWGREQNSYRLKSANNESCERDGWATSSAICLCFIFVRFINCYPKFA